MNVRVQGARLRIDELAQRSGIATGTIRFYQREGLIEPPERDGRVAYYGDSHLRRLERVRALQAQGLPLSVIGDLLDREDAGEDIGRWLALDSAVFGPRHGAERVDEQVLTTLGFEPGDVDALIDGGVFRREGDGSVSALPGMMELIARLVEAGVAAPTIRAGAGMIATRLAEIAESMATLGWDSFAAERERIADADPEVVAETVAKLDHLRSLARRIVSTQFPVLLDEAINVRAETFAAELTAKGRR